MIEGAVCNCVTRGCSSLPYHPFHPKAIIPQKDGFKRTMERLSELYRIALHAALKKNVYKRWQETYLNYNFDGRDGITRTVGKEG